MSNIQRLDTSQPLCFKVHLRWVTVLRAPGRPLQGFQARKASVLPARPLRQGPAPAGLLPHCRWRPASPLLPRAPRPERRGLRLHEAEPPARSRPASPSPRRCPQLSPPTPASWSMRPPHRGLLSSHSALQRGPMAVAAPVPWPPPAPAPSLSPPHPPPGARQRREPKYRLEASGSDGPVAAHRRPRPSRPPAPPTALRPSRSRRPRPPLQQAPPTPPRPPCLLFPPGHLVPLNPLPTSRKLPHFVHHYTECSPLRPLIRLTRSHFLSFALFNQQSQSLNNWPARPCGYNPMPPLQQTLRSRGSPRGSLPRLGDLLGHVL